MLSTNKVLCKVAVARTFDRKDKHVLITVTMKILLLQVMAVDRLRLLSVFLVDSYDCVDSNVGVERFRILGGGGKRGPKSQQAHDVVLTSMRHNDVASTSFRPHVHTRFLINQCQIIIFLILKSDNIEHSRIELKGVVLPIPSNQIKVTFIIILPFSLVHL